MVLLAVSGSAVLGDIESLGFFFGVNADTEGGLDDGEDDEGEEEGESTD